MVYRDTGEEEGFVSYELLGVCGQNMVIDCVKVERK